LTDCGSDLGKHYAPVGSVGNCQTIQGTAIPTELPRFQYYRWTESWSEA